MTRYRLLALDIDGTLVDRSLEVTPRNREALRRAIAAGTRVVLATGRMVRSARPYAELIGTEEPMICYQGAVVAAPGGTFLREWPLTAELAAVAVDFGRDHDLHVNLYQGDDFFIERTGWGADRYAAVAQVEPRLVKDLREVAAGGSTKVVFVAEPDRLREVEKDVAVALAPGARVTFSLPEFLEAVAADVSKARALAFICERDGVRPEEVIAAGDAPNDLELFAYAGMAVAPRDAHPEVLARAAATIAPPGEDGIAELVERYLLEDATTI